MRKEGSEYFTRKEKDQRMPTEKEKLENTTVSNTRLLNISESHSDEPFCVFHFAQECPIAMYLFQASPSNVLII
jgi:hypothetical protein